MEIFKLEQYNFEETILMFMFVGANNFLDNLIAKAKIISIFFFLIPEFHN
jgi:hypothetical protein